MSTRLCRSRTARNSTRSTTASRQSGSSRKRSTRSTRFSLEFYTSETWRSFKTRAFTMTASAVWPTRTRLSSSHNYSASTRENSRMRSLSAALWRVERLLFGRTPCRSVRRHVTPCLRVSMDVFLAGLLTSLIFFFNHPFSSKSIFFSQLYIITINLIYSHSERKRASRSAY